MPQSCRPHGVRFFLGIFPFDADRVFPPLVRGPVDNPPCNLHRPLLYKSRRLHGVPARVFALQVMSRSSSRDRFIINVIPVSYFGGLYYKDSPTSFRLHG